MEPVSLPRRLLNGWLAIVARFGFVQTSVILAVFYVLLIGPVALWNGLVRSDLLDKRGLRAPESAWQDADTSGADLERAKQMT